MFVYNTKPECSVLFYNDLLSVSVIVNTLMVEC